jgi:hypothetical protein
MTWVLATPLIKLEREGRFSSFWVKQWFSNPALNLPGRLHIVNAVEQIKLVGSSLSDVELMRAIELKREAMGLSLFEFTRRVLMADKPAGFWQTVIDVFVETEITNVKALL